MSQNLSELFKKHSAYYEVQPYYVVVDQRQHGIESATTRVQVGFDVDIYGVVTRHELGRPADYGAACRTLDDLALRIMRQVPECSVEVIPYDSSVFLDTSRHLEEHGMLCIRITHQSGMDQEGATEERALNEVEKEMHNLGLSQGRSRLSA